MNELGCLRRRACGRPWSLWLCAVAMKLDGVRKDYRSAAYVVQWWTVLPFDDAVLTIPFANQFIYIGPLWFTRFRSRSMSRNLRRKRHGEY
eukprot:1191442-Prorocentrum_minimum.AAC.1